MGLVKQEKFGPFFYGEAAIFWMDAAPRESDLVHSGKHGDNGSALFVYVCKQLIRSFCKYRREVGVLFCYITAEFGIGLLLHFFQACDENGLIGRKVSDVLEGAPFIRLDTMAESFFRGVADQLADGLVLKFKPAERGC